MNDMILYIVSYSIIIVLGFLILNFLTVGYLGTYLLVKMSRGKKLLVKVWSPTRVYYKTGKIIEGALVYSFHDGKKKTQKRISGVSRSNIYREMNVDCIEVDEETNAIVNTRDFSVVKGFDAVKEDGMIDRALHLPTIEDKTQFIILTVLMIVAVIGIGVLIYLTIVNNGGVAAVTGNV